MPIGMPGWPEFAFCTASMASARSALASSCLVAIDSFVADENGAIATERQTRTSQAVLRSIRARHYMGNPRAARRCRTRTGPTGDSCYGSRRDELDAELLELAVQVRALQPDAVGHLAHVRAFARDVILEVHALERVARLAQLQVERQRRRARPTTGASSSARHC